MHRKKSEDVRSVTSQSGQIVSSTAATTERAGHGRVVEVLVHFATVLLILVGLRLLRSEKRNRQKSFHDFFHGLKIISQHF